MINKSQNKLHEYYTQLLNLKFPDNTIENDDLADVHSDLAEIDAYYAGLVKTILETSIEKKIDFDYLVNLRNKLNDISRETLSEDDVIVYKECDNYLAFLEKLQNLII